MGADALAGICAVAARRCRAVSQNKGSWATTTRARPAQGVRTIKPCSTKALPVCSPSVIHRLNADIFKAEGKSTAFGDQRSAVPSIPVWNPGAMPTIRDLSQQFAYPDIQWILRRALMPHRDHIEAGDLCIQFNRLQRVVRQES